jgi:hypothetical protein
MKNLYKKLLSNSKHSLFLMGIIAICLMLVAVSSPFVSSNFGLQSYAAVEDGDAQISFGTTSSNVYQGSIQVLPVFGTTSGRDVVGFQMFFNFTGSTPQDIAFVPNPDTGLQVIKNEADLDNNVVKVALIAPLASPFNPFSSIGLVELGSLEYTVPEVDGSFSISFDSENTISVEHQTNQDLAQIPDPVTFTFITEPTPTIESSPSPIADASPTVVSIGDVAPTPSPSPEAGYDEGRTSKFRKWFRSFVKKNWSWNRWGR